VTYSFWAYLFLDQGPIYAPLIIGAILTVIAVRLKLAPGAILLMAAAYYTRSARWTWAYAPGLWAGMLALSDIREFNFNSITLKALIKPVVLGISGYFGGHLIPIIQKSLKTSTEINLLPNPAASTSRQPLLWERLFPNPTYPAGILLSLLWATLPLIILLAVLLITKKWRLKCPQGLAFLAVSAAFLIVGIIASVKIGGGSNLHNLDMYLVTLVLIAGKTLSEILLHIQKPKKGNPGFQIILIIAMLGPVSFNIYGGERLSLPPADKTNEALAAVQNKVDQFSAQGEVLFIDQRQLLTFGYVPRIPLIADYEKKYLMDQAMASNAKYFSGFYSDLAAKRFVLIVNEPSNLVIRGSEYSFGEENDAYVKWVTQPLLCAYEPIYTSPEAGIELLVPRENKINGAVDCSMVEPNY
jgi:hypothetical protein